MTVRPSSTRLAARLRAAVRPLTDPPLLPGPPAGIVAAGECVPPRPAAVLVPIVARGAELSMLFTVRTAHLANHAGQVSFPGGRIEEDDADEIAAALRETYEETGIGPDRVEPFGYLDCLATVSGYCVAPVVGFVRGDYQARPQPEEVAELFEVPLEVMLAPDCLQRRRVEWHGRLRDIYEFDWQGRRIWGATAAILRDLVRRMEKTA
jgi:8-oxo-dGTP pyrophosphatase MutT (NUDIX family)